MSRMVFAVLGALLVRDCDITGPGPGTIITGTWGGDNGGLIADDTSAHVHIKCTYGDVHQAIVIGTGGSFDVPGEYMLHAYPLAVGPTMPARFHGTVSGWVMTLSVTVTDTVGDSTAELGPVKLGRGLEPKMWPCPICRLPHAARRRVLMEPLSEPRKPF